MKRNNAHRAVPAKLLGGLSMLALVALAACADTGAPRQVSAAPPTVSYRVPANDVSQANVSAAQYCSQYGMGAQLQSVQPQGSESIAYYGCTGTPVASAAPAYSAGYPVYPSTYPSQVYAAPAAPVQCADFLHQSRPGGSNYTGPYVAGCPQR